MEYNLKDKYILQLNEKEKALETRDLNIFYGEKQALFDGNLQFERYKITSLIGASGSGKSTFLRSLNRMNEGVADVKGSILYRGIDINSPKINVYEMRKYIGMVFQRPNPFSKSIYENITFALKENGIKDKEKLAEIVETSLKQAALSGGQQQRLCIARAIAMKPDILLLDEPASALDPISTAKIEETLLELKEKYTLIIVTHNMQQASRISDYTAFFHLGNVIEYNKTKNIFTNPKIKLTEDYISGNFG